MSENKLEEIIEDATKENNFDSKVYLAVTINFIALYYSDDYKKIIEHRCKEKQVDFSRYTMMLELKLALRCLDFVIQNLLMIENFRKTNYSKSIKEYHQNTFFFCLTEMFDLIDKFGPSTVRNKMKNEKLSHEMETVSETINKLTISNS